MDPNKKDTNDESLVNPQPAQPPEQIVQPQPEQPLPPEPEPQPQPQFPSPAPAPQPQPEITPVTTTPDQSVANQPQANNVNSSLPENPGVTPANSFDSSQLFAKDSGSDFPRPKTKIKKKLFIAGGVVATLLLAVGGFVFGYYIPNQPENVYSTGLDRSGEAIHKMIIQSTESAKLEQIKKSEFIGSLDITSNEGSINGSFDAKLDPTKTNSSFNIKFKDAADVEQSYELKLLTELQNNERLPDIYFKFAGIKQLQLDSFVPGISDYDNKWIAIESNYLESFAGDFLPPEEKDNKQDLSAQEVADLIRGISEVSNEYLFTSDPDKAVLENREYLGKEKTAEGVDSFHYKVGINKDHSVDYCKAIIEKLSNSVAIKKISDSSDEDIAKSKNEGLKNCDSSAKDVNDSDTFEMWIDAKYKIIHKIRVYNIDSSENNEQPLFDVGREQEQEQEQEPKTDKYTDIGQVYTGGDKLNFFILYHQDEDNLNAKFSLDVNLKELNSKAGITLKQDGDDAFNATASITAKSYDGEIDTKKPAGAISIKEILKKFGLDSTSPGGVNPVGNSPIQQKANDSEIKSDLQAMASQVEVYFADNVAYPTLAELNNKAFRTSKLLGLQDAALTPPNSTNSQLAASPSASQYGYKATDCDSSGCQKFILSAILSTGETHEVVGSNN